MMISGSSAPTHEDECPLEHLTRSHHLQMAYKEALRTADFTVQEEMERRLQLQILLLEDDNDDLNGQLSAEDVRICGLEVERDDLRRSLDQAELRIRQHEGDLRASARELNNLKAELASMNGVSSDSTRLLTEKLSLARDLAALKPEVEHLRVQVAQQQTLLAEKLALQRQISTLEVELETEKRASKRATQKQTNNDREEGLQAQVDDLRKELAKERRERERQQKAAEKETVEWQARKSLLDGKLDDFRTKLRSTKTQLKETQVELTRVEAAATATGSKMAAASVVEESIPPNPRKRSIVQMSVDAAIGTPDGVAFRGKRAGAKRGRPDHNALGEKSMFSITPFLNRTVSAAPETPCAEVEDETEEVRGEEAQETEDFKVILKKPSSKITTIISQDVSEGFASVGSPVAPTQRVTKKSVSAKVSKGTKIINNEVDVASKRQGQALTLESVAEGDENSDPAAHQKTTAKSRVAKPTLKVSNTMLETEEPKKKKRKLLGAAKTLFDEDDVDAPVRPKKVVLGAVKPLVKTGSRVNQLAGGSGSAGFGAFSPLKRDKRGANATFLG